MITECHKSSDKLGESVAQIRAKLNEVIRALNNKEAHPRADNSQSMPCCQEFHQWCIETKGLSLSTVRNDTVLARHTFGRRCRQFEEAFMSVSNLKRWGVRILANGLECDGSMCVVPNGEYVKFEEAMEASSNSLQQLKAEIAAIVERLQRAYAMRESPDVLNCISELRQLSAV